jgi:hypothetical protein
MNDEIKTVTHEGQVYQIGKNYLFSDDGTDFSLAKLVRIKKNGWPFRTDDNDLYRYIHEVSALKSMGTITPAPIELVDGAAYMFNSHKNNLLDAIGIYSKYHNTLTTFKNLCTAFDCTNIRLMTVESK